MNKYLISALLLLVLFAAGCDRFEHKFEPEQNNIGLDQFGQSLADAINATDQYNYLELGTLFSENYYNDDLTKTDIIDYFGNFFQLDPNATFIADSVMVSPSLMISWHFQVLDSSREILADEVFTDYLIEQNDGFVLYGNHNNSKKILVELFTGQWCSNCPNAEEAMHELRAKYSSRFIYVEYHIGDQMAINSNNDIFSYYPQNGTLPFGIVNGNAHFLYTAPTPEEVLAEIEAAIEPLLQEIPNVVMSNVQTDLSDTELSGTVDIEIQAYVDLNNLTLNAVLMEDYNDEFLNYASEPHHNIVLQRSEMSISDISTTDTVEFTISGLDQLAPWYTELPQDLVLVLWIQTKTPNYNESTCTVHNVIEIPL
ncbi:MAG: hypothetical protein K9N09_10365 [Candidatus Cloacimonetes bacterium]|nr:hypothetical protein [Candidatus Cloacimonadota bacterium]MCF7814582.1 hypothetical protein [Candidatus Cloacimonadota bacterium]MCF7869095.1 hypothetical protein [Candidatus Cloacimonadota bacterium]MCF7884512.1 hypothetical protein [Candidatus Cloacimonadota bacterium]